MSEPDWPDCLEDGYFINGSLHPGYVVRDRMEPLARMMAEARLTSHQVRRFFQHCRAIEARLRGKTSKWERELIEVKKLDIAVADAFGKFPPKVPEIFRDFIQRNVAAVKTKEDFLDGFLPHFEALIGFGSAYFRSERN